VTALPEIAASQDNGGIMMKVFEWQAGDPAVGMKRTCLPFLKSFRGNVSAEA
jgi:hypothetical protein